MMKTTENMQLSSICPFLARSGKIGHFPQTMITVSDKPDGFLRSPRHTLTATVVFD